MATAKLSQLICDLGRRLPGPQSPASDDGELLTRFLATRDEEAFTLLVRRHGPMVFGVCRRVTGNHHLAEDAFQAVFVVLAAKAGSVRPQSVLPAWLYGVAYRTALRARTMSDRRRRRETPVETLPESADLPTDPVGSSDLVTVLDEEIAQLPETLRASVILCEIQGRSRKEAAGQLGIAEGTLSSRLAAARKALAGRLRNRGIALSTAGLSVALGQVASAAVPADLTIRAITAAVSPGIISAPVATLSNGVLHLMLAHKLKSVSVALGLAVTAICGSLLFASDPPTPITEPRPLVAFADPPQPGTTPRAKATDLKPLPKGPNKLLFFRAGHINLIDPDGKNDTQVTKDGGKFQPGAAKLSPDGKRLAVLIQDEADLVPRDSGLFAFHQKIHVRDLTGPEPGTNLGVFAKMFYWSPDGSEIVYCDYEEGQDKVKDITNGIINVATKETTNLKMPEGHVIMDWSRDGKSFLTSKGNSDRTNPMARLYLINRDGTGEKALTPANLLATGGRLSPDGKRVLFGVMTPPPKDKPFTTRIEPTVLDLATGKLTPVADIPLNSQVFSYCWSADGKQIAYAWRETHVGKPEDLLMKETESHLVVCDPDGKNPKTIASEKGTGQWIITIGNLDWR
jgi:RNA polymerase sigma factor (sigma-70 family)